MNKIFFLIIVFALAACKARPSVEIDYSQDWSFSEVLSLERLFDKSLDDWQQINLPNKFYDRKNQYGFILLKKKLTSYTVENILEQESLVFTLGRVSDVVFIYINDKLIFQSGSILPYRSSFDQYITTEIKSADLHAEGDNVVSVVLYNSQHRPSFILGPNIQIGNSVLVLENYHYAKMLAFVLPLIVLLFSVISFFYEVANRRQNISAIYVLFALSAVIYGSMHYLRWYEMVLQWQWAFHFFTNFFVSILSVILAWDFLSSYNLTRKNLLWIITVLMTSMALINFTFDYKISNYSTVILSSMMIVLMLIVNFYHKYILKTKSKVLLYKKISYVFWFTINILVIVLPYFEKEFFFLVASLLFMMAYFFDKIQNSGDLFSFLDDEAEVEQAILHENQENLELQQNKLFEKSSHFLAHYKKLSLSEAKEQLSKERQNWHLLLKECLLQNAHALCLDVAQYLIDLDENDIAANFAKAYCLKKTMQHHEALQIALKVYDMQPQHRQNLTLIVQLYLLLSEKSNAAHYCRIALEFFPHDERLQKFETLLKP